MAGKRKREVDQDDAVVNGATPKRRPHAQRTNGHNAEDYTLPDSGQVVETPTRTRRGRPPGSGQKLFSTLSKITTKSDGCSSAPTPRNLDRSVRKKGAKTLPERTVSTDLSDDDAFREDNILVRKIWGADEAESDEAQDATGEELVADDGITKTPPRRRRGRRKKSPTPSQDLPPHEQHFWQNRPGKIKTSNNTLSSLSLLTHEEYHKQTSGYKDPHDSSIAFLKSLHSRSFPQWHFELSQSFNLCLYGYGSKRDLVTAFANYLHKVSPATPPKILIANGYTPALTIRQVLTCLATVMFDCAPSALPFKLGSQAREILTKLLIYLSNNPPSSPYHVFINSIDAPPLRRSPTPALLAQLAASPHIHLLATCDSPNFPLLWDTNLYNQYNFLFHDSTTFVPYTPVETGSVIDTVNELLGRSGRSVKGKEGVSFVLRSLPENARNLYRVLVAELLAGLEESEGIGGVGIEYKVLYSKVVEEFICSNEMGFRQLLKEFYDHQMISVKRDGSGAEILGVPWRKEEMEALLEDLLD